MWIFFCVAECMVVSVHSCIRPWVQKGRSLTYISHQIKDALKEFAGSEHLMRSISVQKEGLEKQ